MRRRLSTTQAKHIPSFAFLAAVREASAATGYASVGDLSAALNVDEALIRAKAKKLIGLGLIDGCACGCRGDFRLVI